MYLLQAVVALPTAWIAAQWAEGAYHRKTGHDEGRWSQGLHEMHADHHDHPTDASDGEYARMLIAISIGLALAIGVRPVCPEYTRGALDAALLVALVFPYVSWTLHGEFHDPDTPLGDTGWFQNLRARHRVHHISGGTCNFGITSPTYDMIHSTNKGAELPKRMTLSPVSAITDAH
jgi:sterol desaturase/sphingolipid hydroxylase (fatty acid hydroxylase superfamily)